MTIETQREKKLKKNEIQNKKGRKKRILSSSGEPLRRRNKQIF
jgi:hypothetical protein